MEPGKKIRAARGNQPAAFATTQWTVVIAAGREESAVAREALANLCVTYWYPLYAYARRRGYRVEQAEDLTQSFFARFLEKRDVKDARRDRGKFRSFLLASFKHFLANEYDRDHAQKRGGQAEFLHIDIDVAEHQYNIGSSLMLTPDQEFDKQWALAILNDTLAALAADYAAAGKAGLFDRLRSYLPGGVASQTYQECADALATSEAAVKMAVLRMRNRYRRALRKRIADTLSDIENVDDEIRYLLHVVAQ